MVTQGCMGGKLLERAKGTAGKNSDPEKNETFRTSSGLSCPSRPELNPELCDLEDSLCSGAHELGEKALSTHFQGQVPSMLSRGCTLQSQPGLEGGESASGRCKPLLGRG